MKTLPLILVSFILATVVSLTAQEKKAKRIPVKVS